MEQKPFRHEAYRLLLEISDELRHSSYERTVVEERFIHHDLHRRPTGHNTVAVRDLQWTNIAHDCMIGLSGPTKLFIIENIVPVLKQYNLLWHWNTPTKSSEKNILKQLVEIGIIFRTETVGIYLVNPIKLWRGNSITCVEATKQLLRDNGKPCIELIHDLRPSDKYISKTAKDDYKQLLDGTGDFSTNILREPDVPYAQED